MAATIAATMAEDIYQLTQQLKLGRPYIVGHDIGGSVAYAFVGDAEQCGYRSDVRGNYRESKNIGRPWLHPIEIRLWQGFS